MSDANRVTRCKRWYELNLPKLRTRELARAAGWPMALFGAVLFSIHRLFGLRWGGGVFFPEEVTLIWDVPLSEIQAPSELDAIGFTPLAAFELPEFSGENVTGLFHDADRQTYCETFLVRTDEGVKGQGVSFSTYVAGEPRGLMRTVQNWQAAPFDPAEHHRYQCVPGSLAQAYRAHRDWLGEASSRVLPTNLDNFWALSGEGHRLLGDYLRERGVWVEATSQEVGKLLSQKGLSRGC